MMIGSSRGVVAPVASMPLMSDEIRQVPAGEADAHEADAHEVWQRLTDEPGRP
jgi:hypothetical protein